MRRPTRLVVKQPDEKERNKETLYSFGHQTTAIRCMQTCFGSIADELPCPRTTFEAVDEEELKRLLLLLPAEPVDIPSGAEHLITVVKRAFPLEISFMQLTVHAEKILLYFPFESQILKLMQNNVNFKLQHLKVRQLALLVWCNFPRITHRQVSTSNLRIVCVLILKKFLFLTCCHPWSRRSCRQCYVSGRTLRRSCQLCRRTCASKQRRCWLFCWKKWKKNNASNKRDNHF